jgi:hypothetical protein
MPVRFVLRLLDGRVYDTPLVAGSDSTILARRLAERARHGCVLARPERPLRGSSRNHTPEEEAEREGPGEARVFSVVSSLVELPFRDRTFDLVVACASPELVASPARMAFELGRVSSNYVLIVLSRSTDQEGDAPVIAGLEGARGLDPERLAGLVTGAGLRVARLDTWTSDTPASAASPLGALALPLKRAVRHTLEMSGIRRHRLPDYLGVLAIR